MHYTSSAKTDIGIAKKINQDCVFIMSAETEFGPVLMAAVCDGMGGLADGEVASLKTVQAIREWFSAELPKILYTPERAVPRKIALSAGLNAMCRTANETVSAYAAEKDITCGSTLAALLLIGDMYVTVNVGDSRVYLLRDRLFLLTKDQTYVQMRIDEGSLSETEAKVHPKRNVLVQCIGCNENVIPEIKFGECSDGDVFLLCSDGFRHKLTHSELEEELKSSSLYGEAAMGKTLEHLIAVNKERKEKDNISAILVRADCDSEDLTGELDYPGGAKIYGN